MPGEIIPHKEFIGEFFLGFFQPAIGAAILEKLDRLAEMLLELRSVPLPLEQFRTKGMISSQMQHHAVPSVRFDGSLYPVLRLGEMLIVDIQENLPDISLNPAFKYLHFIISIMNRQRFQIHIFFLVHHFRSCHTHPCQAGPGRQ